MIETYETLYKYFESALNFVLTGPNKIERKAIAADAKISVQYLGQIIDPENPKKASLEAQKKIAAAAGYTFESFLELGRKLISSAYPKGKSENLNIGDKSANDINPLLMMAKQVLSSKTNYAESLSSIINSFYIAVENDVRMNNLEILIKENFNNLDTIEKRYQYDRRQDDRRKIQLLNIEIDRRNRSGRRKSDG